MPTYEYECSKCGKVFELSQSITEPRRRRLKRTDPSPCDCRATVTRLISTGGGLIFKGSGFYQTDYRSESYKQAAKADASGNGKAATDGKSSDNGKGGGETKTESETAPSEKTSTAKKSAKKE